MGDTVNIRLTAEDKIHLQQRMDETGKKATEVFKSAIYFTEIDAPDLEWVGKNGWRFVNAVSDFATHADPIRKTRNYNENLFLRTAEGNPMIDKAYKMVLSAA